MKSRLSILGILILLSQFLAGGGVARGLAAGEQTGQKQQPPQKQDDSEPGESNQTVHLGTELVNVLFSAVDSSNGIVSDLRQNEIQVLEDGQPQEIFTFRREVNLPLNIAILIDLSGSQEYTFPEEKMAAGYFLHSVIRSGKDSAALLTFMDDVDLVQGLTSRLENINRALDEVEYARRVGPVTSRNQATALYDAVYITVDEVLGREEIRKSADDSMTRRAIILLTDGVDNASNRKLTEAIDRAWKSGVMIYSIGIGDRFRFEGVREDVLRKMSEETGGRAYFPRGSEELTKDFQQIEGNLRSQYLVAYAPTNPIHDGSFHRIDVRIANRSGVRVIHRRGYYAPLEDGRK
jgi:Ca-activated chloride channel family protein